MWPWGDDVNNIRDLGASYTSETEVLAFLVDGSAEANSVAEALAADDQMVLYYDTAGTALKIITAYTVPMAAGEAYRLVSIGGGGFTEGPATNTFTGTTKTIAEAARDTYAAANAAWLAQYDADGTLYITLTVGTAITFQVRFGSVWIDATAFRKGDMGDKGDAGTAAVDGTDGTDGIDGVAGTDGAPGGGAFELVGTFTATIGAGNDDIWLDMGFNWPVDSKWIRYSAAHRVFDFDGEMVYGEGGVGGLPAVAVGAASTTTTRLQYGEAYTGVMYFGRTAANRAVVEFSASAGAVVVSFYKYIPAEEGPPGVTRTDGEIQAIINASSLSSLQGQVTDAQIPAAIARDAEFGTSQLIALITGQIAFSDIAGMVADGQVPSSFFRDAELTLAIVATALGLTTTEAAEILTGDPTISGSDLTFTQNDGTTVTVTLPAGGTGTGRWDVYVSVWANLHLLSVLMVTVIST